MAEALSYLKNSSYLAGKNFSIALLSQPRVKTAIASNIFLSPKTFEKPFPILVNADMVTLSLVLSFLI